MDLLERIIFFAIGGGVGFILGYVVAQLRNIEVKVDAVKREVHEVDNIVKHVRDERGYAKPSFTSIMLVVVLLLTVAAAVMTGVTNRKITNVVRCNTEFNTNQNIALNARDDAIRDAASAEIGLWGLYEKLYKEARRPDTSPQRLIELQDTLTAAIVEYREKLIETRKVRQQFEYDEPDILKDCEGKQDD